MFQHDDEKKDSGMTKTILNVSVTAVYTEPFKVDEAQWKIARKLYAYEVEMRLKEWATWRRKILEAGNGYPSQATTVTALPGSRSTAPFYPPDNPRAEQVDKAFAHLKVRHPDWAQVMEAEYICTKLELDRNMDMKLSASQEMKAQKLGMKRTNYQGLLKAAKGFVESILTYESR